MDNSIASGNGNGRARVSGRNAVERSQARDLWLEDLKTAMKTTGWTIDSLAAHLEKDRSYVSRMLSDDKPFPIDAILALPDDLEAELEARRAERLGRIVVMPLYGQDALKALVAGLIGVMSAPALADRATSMATAAIGRDKKTRTA